MFDYMTFRDVSLKFRLSMYALSQLYTLQSYTGVVAERIQGSRIGVRLLSSVHLDGVRCRRTRTHTCNFVRETFFNVQMDGVRSTHRTRTCVHIFKP